MLVTTQPAPALENHIEHSDTPTKLNRKHDAIPIKNSKDASSLNGRLCVPAKIDICDNGSQRRRLSEEESVLPSRQAGVLTPTVGKELSLQWTDSLLVSPPGEAEVVVKIAWTGICRSDACFSLGPEPGYPKHNHIAGHEGIGIVVQCADKSRLSRPVAIRYIGTVCNVCWYCTRGLIESCPGQSNFPKHHTGTFQQYVTVPWSALMELPEWIFNGDAGIGPEFYTGALCSGSAALKSLRAANIQPGDVVVISGILGAIGHFAGMIAKTVFGARVIGMDWGWKEKNLPSSFARDRVYDKFIPACVTPSDQIPRQRLFQALREACDELRGMGKHSTSLMAQSVIVTASSTSAFQSLSDLVCDGGSIICVGVPRGECLMSISLQTLVERQVKIQGTMMGGHAEVLQVMKWIRDGVIKPEVTEVSLQDVSGCLNDCVDFRTVGKMVARVNGHPFSG